MKPLRLEQLTFTRFISAFIILVSHFKPVELVNDNWFVPLFHNFFAVSYFFTLSGFVLGISYYDRFQTLGATELKKYFVARFARIYPVYLFALVLSLAIEYYATRTIRHSTASIFLNVTLLQGWFDTSVINFPSWSLSCEAFFYVLFPFCVGYIRKWEASKILKSMMILWAVTQIAMYVIFILLNEQRFYLRLHPVLHTPTFLLGVCLAFLFKKTASNIEQWSRISNWILLGVIISELIGKPHFGFESLQVPHYLLFIYFASTYENFTVKYFKRDFLVLLGKASYALYLLQGSLAAISERLFARYGMLNTNINFLVFVLLSVTVSVLVYQFYEKPLHKGISKMFTS